MGEFPKIRVPYLGVLKIRILVFRVLYKGPLFSETPKSNGCVKIACFSCLQPVKSPGCALGCCRQIHENQPSIADAAEAHRKTCFNSNILFPSNGGWKMAVLVALVGSWPCQPCRPCCGSGLASQARLEASEAGSEELGLGLGPFGDPFS